MGKSTIRLLPLTICAAALVMVPPVTPAEARTNHGKHVRKHYTIHRDPGFYGYRPADQAWPGASPPSRSGDVCPGIARSFDCKVWPPPMDEDPDRKISGSDGG
jgi:hypothetical protein